MKPKSKTDSKLANLGTEAIPRHLDFETEARRDISKVLLETASRQVSWPEDYITAIYVLSKVLFRKTR